MKYKGRDFDATGFGRDLERTFKDVANEALTSDAQALQRACDSTAATSSGQPADEVMRVLQRAIARESIHTTIPDENVRAYAAAISEGRQIDVQVEGL